eukprot:GFYU01002549.1.p1 GENE.GFYU01002549.1~~GFYU01002549.1.p1  ORF type:complete len:393 (+),score=95.85 GFYU01002549.1:150-1328(+)
MAATHARQRVTKAMSSILTTGGLGMRGTVSRRCSSTRSQGLISRMASYSTMTSATTSPLNDLPSDDIRSRHFNAEAVLAHKILDGKKFAKAMEAETKERVEALDGAGWAPRLVSVSIGTSDAVSLYVRNQKRISKRHGVEFVEMLFDERVSREEMLATIAVYNTDPRVTGVIIQRPIPEHLNIRELQQAVHPLKDVEGMHPASVGNIVYNNAILTPCTARAAVELLKSTGLSLKGLKVAVVGHSEIVGKPICFLLMAEGCTITVCHNMTYQLTTETRQADAVFVAVGKAGLITGNMLKPGAAVIDIGINTVETEDGGTKVVGDCDWDSCSSVAGWITPVPGGVGPVTNAYLMRNTVVAAERQKHHYEAMFSDEHLSNNLLMLSTPKTPLPPP